MFNFIDCFTYELLQPSAPKSKRISNGAVPGTVKVLLSELAFKALSGNVLPDDSSQVYKDEAP